MQDEIGEVLRLVAQPLDSRSLLLRGECKFVINSMLLFRINTVLDIIESDTVDIILPHDQRRQLKLLLNLLNNIPKLVVSQRSAESFENVINLSKFKRLTHLELSRVCLDLVTGLESLKTQLEVFVCNRCTKHNTALCKQSQLAWPELKCFDLCHMKLDSTDGLFISKPWIQTLDLSFNCLTVIKGLEHLNHLSRFNASFNRLEKIPEFSKIAETKLEVLILGNNYISDLAGIQALSGLKFLDIRCNFIYKKTAFLHLTNLTNLSSINIDGNAIENVRHCNTYLASCLSRKILVDQFLLNNKNLKRQERSVVGRTFNPCPVPSTSQQVASSSNPSNTNEIAIDTTIRSYKSKKRIQKPREVIIQDNPTDGIPTTSQKKESKVETEVINSFTENCQLVVEKEQLLEKMAKLQVNSDETEPSSEKQLSQLNDLLACDLGEQESQGSDVEQTTLLINATVHAPDTMSVDIENTSEDKLDETKSDENLVENNKVKSTSNDCQESLNPENAEIDSAGTSDNQVLEDSMPEITNPVNDPENPVNDIENTVNLINDSENTVNDSEILLNDPENSAKDSKIILNDPENPVNDSKSLINDSESDVYENENISSSTISQNKLYQSNESLESLAESLSEEEDLWHVQVLDNVTGEPSNIILVLLETELRERSVKNSKILTRWPLNSIQSCTKTKIDPVTIEIEFDTMKKDKRHRTYIMEFPDAKVLLKKVYSVLELKTLSSMNQRTYECLKCNSFFVRQEPSAFKKKGSLICCTICTSTLVIAVEEPKLPDIKQASVKSISHSSSHSSIGKGGNVAFETACAEWIPPCSAASLEQYDRRPSVAQKYESDIEVISNPSQSSIEVLGEHSRSTTPRRKISTDDKTVGIYIPPQLTTVMEIASPSTNLTESSSSGSLTESVITAYEAFNNNKKPIITEGILAEEESYTVTDTDLPSDTIVEERPTLVWRENIYSFTDFTDVDPRIQLFLYQEIFQDDNEKLLLLVKSHIWKTGGSDYDGCVVFSTLKVYFFFHSKTNFKENVCDWLSLYDSFKLKDIKSITPIIWQLGAHIRIKSISYLILLIDNERTTVFFKYLKGFSIDVKIEDKVDNKKELSLQQAVLLYPTEKSDDPTVNSFTICLSLTIIKDKVECDILRLVGLITTSTHFLILPGELSWLTSNTTPSIIASQDISYFINFTQEEQSPHSVSLHFFAEKEAIEEIWKFEFVSSAHISFVVDNLLNLFSDRLNKWTHILDTVPMNNTRIKFFVSPRQS